MSKASEIVAIALAQIGYKEKASNKNLDDPAANAGSPFLLVCPTPILPYKLGGRLFLIPVMYLHQRK